MFSNARKDLDRSAMWIARLQTVPYILTCIAGGFCFVDRIGIFWCVLMTIGITVAGYGLSLLCAERLINIGEMKGRIRFAEILSQNNNTD